MIWTLMTFASLALTMSDSLRLTSDRMSVESALLRRGASNSTSVDARLQSTTSLLSTLQGGWSEGAMSPEVLLCGLARVVDLNVQTIGNSIFVNWDIKDENKTGAIGSIYTTELFVVESQPGATADSLEANITLCLSNVSTMLRSCENNGADLGPTWLQSLNTHCQDTSSPDAAARCCSQATIKVYHLRHKIDLQICVRDPSDPSSDPIARVAAKRRCYNWKRPAIEPRTFEFDYCSCDSSREGLGKGTCARGSVVVSEAMAWHCEATVAASQLVVLGSGSLLQCPSSLDQISFTTKELGTVTLDLGSMADSNWMSSQGCYGTLRCVQGPCQDGQETEEETAVRCGQAEPSIKFVYPNTGPTAGGSTITLVGTCFGALLLDDTLKMSVSIGISSVCSNPQVISPSKIACLLGPGFGAMRNTELLLGSRRKIPCADPTQRRCWVHYHKPVVLSVLPTIVPAGGGRVLTVFGRDFGHPLDNPALSLRVIVAGQLCMLDKTTVCPTCGYNKDGIVVCVLAANSLKVAASITIEVSNTGTIRHDCTVCPSGYTATAQPPYCKCVATGSGGEVYHLSSWGKVTMFLSPVHEPSTSNRRAPNITTLRASLVDMLQLESAEQLLFVAAGLDLAKSGALVQVRDVPATITEDGLDIVAFQVLASPSKVDAHVTALFALATAATNGQLREALPSARRVSIPQIRFNEYQVLEQATTAASAPAVSSASWVPILVVIILCLMPCGVGYFWVSFQLPQLRANWRAAHKMKGVKGKREKSALSQVSKDRQMIAGKKFGSPAAGGAIAFSSRSPQHMD